MPTYSVVANDGRMYGPADEIGLSEWVRQGRVERETVLHCHETNQRVAAWTVPALQPVLGLSPQQVAHLLQPPPPPPFAPAGPGYAQPQPRYPQAAPIGYASPC